MRKEYEIKSGTVRNFKCDGEFSVEYDNGKVIIIPKTNNFINEGLDIKETTYKRISAVLWRFKGEKVCRELEFAIKNEVMSILHQMRAEGDIKGNLPVIDVNGDLLLVRLEKLLNVAYEKDDFVSCAILTEKLRSLREAKSRKNDMNVIFLDEQHDEFSNLCWEELKWGYKIRG